MFLFLISLVAGILTILAPCVLPLLPVIVGGSVAGRQYWWRPYGIALSLAVSVIGFTLLLKVSTLLAGVPPDALNWLSGSLVIVLGLVGVFPEFWEWIVVRMNWQAGSQRWLSSSSKYGSIGEPILIGLALGPVFSSCSPTYAFILASVLPRSLGSGLLYLTGYSLALVITLLVISLASRKVLLRLRWVTDTHGWFRRLLGGLFILIGIIVFTGQEIRFETWLAGYLPFDEAKVEQLLLAQQHQSIALSTASGQNVFNVQPTPAPELVGLTNWINSQPLSLRSLRGKVVLLDFWTYSCVNCNRALPYVKNWYQTYKDQGLVVIGVHTPEFAFEHVPANVEQFVRDNHITYPVALDNQYATWNAFRNNAWPADYLIDKQGNIRYTAFGEGDYDITETAIQQLLGTKQALSTPSSVVPVAAGQTPETYFGTNRAERFQPYGQPNLGTSTFTPVASSGLLQDYWTLAGKWQINDESIVSQDSKANILFRVNARDVYVVAGATDGQAHTITVNLPSPVANRFGPDVSNGQLVIDGYRLYHVASLAEVQTFLVTLTVPKGVALYTFTFGS